MYNIHSIMRQDFIIVLQKYFLTIVKLSKKYYWYEQNPIQFWFA